MPEVVLHPGAEMVAVSLGIQRRIELQARVVSEGEWKRSVQVPRIRIDDLGVD